MLCLDHSKSFVDCFFYRKFSVFNETFLQGKSAWVVKTENCPKKKSSSVIGWDNFVALN
jgi:hypothetical protein